MQDDPSKYRVPILKLSDILGENGQNGTTEGTDTAVTGMSWHTVESPAESASVVAPNPGPTVAPPAMDVTVSQKTDLGIQSNTQASILEGEATSVAPTTSPAPQIVTTPNSVSVPSPNKHYIVPIQDILGDALDEPTPHPLGERATASIRATTVAQEVQKEPLPPPPPIPTHPRYEPTQELPDFSLMNAADLAPEPGFSPTPRPRPAKDIDPLDIWDRPATTRGTPTTAPATKAPTVPPQTHTPELLVEKPSVLSMPVPTPPAPAPTPVQEASSEDLSNLLHTLDVEGLSPAPSAPIVTPSPVAPTTDALVQTVVPTPLMHTLDTERSIPVATSNAQRESFISTQQPSVSGGDPQLVQPSPTTAEPLEVTMGDVQPKKASAVRDIWDAIAVGAFSPAKPTLLKTTGVISATPPPSAPTTAPATKAPTVPPQTHTPELLVEKPSVLSMPVPTPPAPAPTPVQEASSEDLSNLLHTLDVEGLPPAPSAPIVTPSPVAPTTDALVQTVVPTPLMHTLDTERSISTATPGEGSIPVVPLGTDVPDMWSVPSEHHVHSLEPEKPTRLSSPVMMMRSEKESAGLSKVSLTASQQNVPPPDGRSNLSALREKVMKESIGKPGETITAPRPGVLIAQTENTKTDTVVASHADSILSRLQSTSNTVGNAHTPNTEHAQAISEIASKLNALQNMPIDGMPTLPTTPVAPSQGVAGEHIVSTVSAEGDALPLMRTFKQDVQQTVLHNKTSVVDMVGSNEKKPALGEVVIRKSKGGSWFTPTLYVLLGTSALLLIGAVGVGVMIFLPAGDEMTTTTYFTPDATIEYDVTSLAREAYIQGLFQIRDGIPIRDGFATQIAPYEKVVLPISGETETLAVTTHRLLRMWEGLPPDTLDRSLTENFMFGYLSLDKNYPFLILESNYFEGAFSGMLDWEQRISAELDPIFPTGGFGAIGRSTSPQSTFVSATTSATTTDSVSRLGLSVFEDITIANVPARILRDTTGNALLLWSMPDDRIVIASNEEVLRRIVDRMEARGF